MFSLICCGCRSQKRTTSLQCPEEFIQTLKETTPLKTAQIVYLYKCFCNLAKDSNEWPPLQLRKTQFLAHPSLQRNPILSLLLGSMFGEKKRLNFVDFAKYLTYFQAFGSQMTPKERQQLKEKKLKLLFNMFDRDKNGIIDEEDLVFIVHKLFADIYFSDKIMNIVSVMLMEMDTSNTNQILFEDFCRAWEIFDMEEYLITKIPS